MHIITEYVSQSGEEIDIVNTLSRNRGSVIFKSSLEQLEFNPEAFEDKSVIPKVIFLLHIDVAIRFRKFDVLVFVFIVLDKLFGDAIISIHSCFAAVFSPIEFVIVRFIWPNAPQEEFFPQTFW